MSEQSRIFMTYSGTMSNVSTLAHELGHAFHSYALRPVHWMNRHMQWELRKQLLHLQK